MNAEIAGELVAPFIEKQWPNDRKEIWQILRLGLNRAWQEGKWLGMTKEFFVPIFKDDVGQSYFMAPQSHPNLLAMNTLSQGATIRDQFFMFHRNGYGDIRERKGCSWNQDVYDLGSTPYFDKNNINFSEGVRIGIRSVGPAGVNERIYINGSYVNGNQVYTYRNTDYGSPCECKIDKSQVDTVKGVELSISTNFNYASNVCFNSIFAITKTVTQSPIEIIALDSHNNGYLIARMEPGQRFSKYRKYLVPDHLCHKTCLHGLFKIAQQDLITSGSDDLLISNEEALISLAKGIYAIYHKEQPDFGAAYIVQAIGVLEKEKREEESPVESPIQVHGIYEDDTADILKYTS